MSKRLGAVLGVSCSLIVLSSVWFLKPDNDMVRVAMIEAAAGTLSGLLFLLMRRHVADASRWWLVYPLVIMATLLAVESTSEVAGVVYSGFITIAFIYVGLTQKRGVSLVIIPPAICVWYLCQTTSPTATAVRTPIVVAIWVLTAELLASRTGRAQVQMGRLHDEAHTDHLTGLGNRRGLDVALAALMPGDMVVLVDLDHFKEVNDSLGHEAGDRVIREFATSLRSVLRASDLAFRYGGEELVVVTKGGDGTAAGADALLGRLQAAWAREERPSYSAGVSIHAMRSASETFARADAALYRAKDEGRNCWRMEKDRGRLGEGAVLLSSA
ncbi:MAG: GGDEF domain-containing protein [Acidimicrobiales bacterium]